MLYKILLWTRPLYAGHNISVKNSFRLPLQCIDTILLNKVDESLQKCAIRVGVVCLYIYFCLFLLARISEFPNVIMLRYACSYRYLSIQNNNNIEVVPNVWRLAIHCHELAIRSIMLMLCCCCIVYSTLSYNILWFYLRLLFLSISCCISHPLHWDPRRMRCI